ncbi:MAG TPA: PAS domain S-box protein [Gemmatimonadales bacterium]
MTVAVSVLLVADDPRDVRRIREAIAASRRGPTALCVAGSLAEAVARLRGTAIDLILLDLGLADATGVESVHALVRAAPDLPIVVLTEPEDDEAAVALLAAGAADYVPKSRLDPDLLSRTMCYAIERGRAERRVRESEERYRGIFEHSLAGFALHRIVTDESGRPVDYTFLSVNKAFEELTGLKADQVVGRKVTEVLPGIERDPFIETYGRVALTGQPERFESFATPLGRCYEVAAFSPRLGQFATIFHDITSRRATEAALRESEATYRALVERLPAIVYRRELGGSFLTYVSPQLEPILGYTPEAWMANPELLVENLHPGDRDRIRLALEQTLSTGEPFRAEYRVARTDGTYVWFSDEAVLLRDHGHPVPQIQGVMVDITARREAELRILERERWFEALIEHAMALIMVVDRDANLIFLSPSVTRLLGYQPDALIGRDAMSLAHPDDVERVRAILLQAVAHPGTPREGELRFRHADGSWRQHVVTGKSMAPGLSGAVVLNSQDITERAAAETALRESQERFRALVESSADWVWEVDEAARYTYCGPACRAILGYEPEELLGRTPFDLMPPAEAEAVSVIFQELAASRRPIQQLENVNLHRNGERVVLETSGVPVIGPEGSFRGYRGIDRDITDRKNAERTLQRFGTMVRQSADLTMLTDVRGKIEYVNPAFEKITGYTSEEAVGQTPRMLKSGMHDDAFYRDMWATLDRGDVFSARFRNRRKDGSVYHQDSIIYPIEDEFGGVVNYVGVGRDVTREVTLEHQLRQSQKMEAVGSLTGGIAHDFNNLLAVILANAGVLEDAIAGNPELTSVVRDMRSAAENGARMVRQLLGFSRKAEIEKAPTDIGRVVSNLATMMQRVIPENILLEVTTDPDLPGVHADAGAIEQASLNLVTNARDAMPHGGRLAVAVRRATVAADDSAYPAWLPPRTYVVVSVADTGDGMGESVRERIFEPFFTTKPEGVGTGLGMAMVYGIVTQHDGFIDIESEVGAGSTISIFLPALEATVTRTQPTPLLGGPDLPGGTETVLFVEDEEALRRTGVRILRSRGYTVIEAATGSAGLAAFHEHRDRVDLIVSDLVMPDMGGLQLLNAVRATGDDVPFLLTTGYSPDRTGGSHDLHAEVPTVIKPWTLGEFLRAVRRTIDDPRGAHPPASGPVGVA